MKENEAYLEILKTLKEHYDKDALFYVPIHSIDKALGIKGERLRTLVENLEMNRFIYKQEGAPIAPDTYLLKIRHKGIDALKAGEVNITRECKLHGPEKMKILEILMDEGFYVPEKTITDSLNISHEKAKIIADELEYCGLAKRVEAMYPNFTLAITDAGIEYLKGNKGASSRHPKFEIYKHGKEYRFRLIAPNGVEIAKSQAYDSKANCIKGLESVKRNAGSADTVDLTE